MKVKKLSKVYFPLSNQTYICAIPFAGAAQPCFDDCQLNAVLEERKTGLFKVVACLNI